MFQILLRYRNALTLHHRFVRCSRQAKATSSGRAVSLCASMGKRERIRARQLKKKMAAGKLKRGGAQFKKLARQKKRADRRAAPAFKNPLRYEQQHRILVLGDGDFSFSAGLVAHRGGHGNGIVTTSYDSQKTVLKKYSTAARYIYALKSSGAAIAHGIDATRLHQADVQTKLCAAKRQSSVKPPSIHGGNKKRKQCGAKRGNQDAALKFDRIVFNFPHTGKQRVHDNRAMVSSFLSSAQSLLAPGGQIHVTIRMHPPYSLWGIPELASKVGLVRSDDNLLLLELFVYLTSSVVGVTLPGKRRYQGL